MKKLEKLRLNQLAQRSYLNELEMDLLWGSSGNCSCGCLYAGQPGGSSTSSNQSANNASDLYSPGYGGGGSNTNYSYEWCGTYINDNYSCEVSENCSVQPNKCGN
ncbi:MAG: TIGR04149 family rSAM-modified RiPP [Candidatus Azobacteroides sp.]|nr:TIGR04149 family rSAM-modified RiPP [Candidatus Azobacteroides sp.]